MSSAVAVSLCGRDQGVGLQVGVPVLWMHELLTHLQGWGVCLIPIKYHKSGG